ncbi:unnamed protein product [Amoebophrya sp. A120]|nr:unnamed protein product [Amoebophrya sp. A120]|eukprot:GSA120T00011293001.1
MAREGRTLHTAAANSNGATVFESAPSAEKSDGSGDQPRGEVLPEKIKKEWSWIPTGAETFPQTLLRLQCEAADLFISEQLTSNQLESGSSFTSTSASRLQNDSLTALDELLRQRQLQGSTTSIKQLERTAVIEKYLQRFRREERASNQQISSSFSSAPSRRFSPDLEHARFQQIRRKLLAADDDTALQIRSLELRLAKKNLLHSEQEAATFLALEKRLARLEQATGVFDLDATADVATLVSACEEDYRDLFRPYNNIRTFDAALRSLREVLQVTKDMSKNNATAAMSAAGNANIAKNVFAQGRKIQRLYTLLEERLAAKPCMDWLRSQHVLQIQKDELKKHAHTRVRNAEVAVQDMRRAVSSLKDLLNSLQVQMKELLVGIDSTSNLLRGVA